MLEKLRGIRPQVAPTAFVHAAATLIGDVVVGPRASVWPAAVLRGDDGAIVIGAETSIQDGTVIHATEGVSHTTVGARVTVGHKVILHGCTIGDNSLIGMGSIVLDNAVVEPWSFVAAGTVIPPGKVVRSGEMVMGNPFRVVRQLTAKDREWIEHAWTVYVKRAAEYLAERSG